MSPFGITPVKKKHIRLGHAGIVDHSVDLSIPDFKKVYKKKEWTEAIKKIMQNSKYQCHMAACCTYHRPTTATYRTLLR